MNLFEYLSVYNEIFQRKRMIFLILSFCPLGLKNQICAYEKTNRLSDKNPADRTYEETGHISQLTCVKQLYFLLTAKKLLLRNQKCFEILDYFLINKKKNSSFTKTIV